LLSDSYWNDEWLTPADRTVRRTGAISLPQPAPWPRQMPLALLGTVNALPVPGQSVFEFSGETQQAARAIAAQPSRRAEPAVSTEHAKNHAKHSAVQPPAETSTSRRAAGGKAQVERASTPHPARPGRHAAQPRRPALKRMVQVKKRSV
jgi:hypothetical protein